MACERNMYSANEAMELVLQSNADDKELTESEAETDSEFEDEEENTYDAVIGDGGADFSIIVGCQPQQQQTEVEYVDNSQRLVADMYQDVEINDNLTADNLDNIEIPQKSKKRKRVADDVPAEIWKKLTGDEIDSDEPVHLYRFSPLKPPGVQPGVNLDENSTPLTCFQALFTDDIQDSLLTMINDFANVKIQQNNPHLRRSMYAKWVPIARYEVYNFLALFVATSLKKRPYLKDYWSQNNIYYLGITELCQGDGTKQSTIPCYMQAVSMKIMHKKRLNHFWISLWTISKQHIICIKKCLLMKWLYNGEDVENINSIIRIGQVNTILKLLVFVTVLPVMHMVY